MTTLVDMLDIECLLLVALFGLWIRSSTDFASSEALVTSQAMRWATRLWRTPGS